LTTDGEQAAVTPIGAINQLGNIGNDSGDTQEEEPEISQSDGQHKARYAFGVTQTAGLQIEAVAFDVTEHGFNHQLHK
jgi:hypothetical protein